MSWQALLSPLATAAAALLALNALAWVQQPGMTFFPDPVLHATPRDWGFEYQDVAIATGDGERLHGWLIRHPQARGTLLFLHGNAGNISHRGESVRIFHRLGLDVLLVDYRGYGRSTGRPSESGLYEDARAAWQYLIDQRGAAPAQVVVFGRSLGAAVAARLAAEVRPGRLILESPPASMRAMARAHFPLLSRVVMLRYRFETVSHVRAVRCPVLVLHSPDDEIVPFEQGLAVFEAAPPPKRMVRLRGDHNAGFLASQPDYAEALAAFIGSGAVAP